MTAASIILLQHTFRRSGRKLRNGNMRKQKQSENGKLHTPPVCLETVQERD